jgi:hypothetical protein
MKRFLLVALWVAVAVSICACGEDDEWSKLKARCVDDYCAVVQRCSTNPTDYSDCVSSCNAFNNADDGEEYKDFFLCKMECVDAAASPDAECECLKSYANGGPNC